MFRLGVVGLGRRIFEGVLPSLFQLSDEVIVTAIADPAEESVRKRMETKPEYFSEDVKVYVSANEMLEKEELDAIIIGTRCSLHTEMTIRAMEKRVPIFLEKPVCTNMEDFSRLAEANRKYAPKVVVSFPLRFSALSVFAKELIDSGKIGEVLQVDAYNDVPYGRVYFHDWYRDESETGGLWLQKATHDFDYLNYILGDRVEEVFARSVRKLFKGDLPAGTTCDTCENRMTCPEAPFMIEHVYQDVLKGNGCCFAKDTGNEDCGTALLKCESGAIVSYEQNFFARHKAARRGARFYGYKGTLEFDWYKNEIKVFMHNSPRVETYSFEDKGNTHFGGDLKLAEMFLQMLRGESDASYLKEGLESALICLKAKESCETGKNLLLEKV